MNLKINYWNTEHDGLLSESAMKNILQDKGYQVTRYVYPPGTCFPDHSHSVDKIDGVLSGRFKMTMQGHSVVLEAGDTLVVPTGVVHSAEVVGDDSVVSLALPH